MITRWARDADLETIQSWWKGRGKSPLMDGFCPNLAVCEREGVLLAAAALHLDRNGVLSFIAYMCASPQISKKDRGLGLDGVLEFLETQARNEGYRIFGCFTDTPPIAGRLSQSGFGKKESGMDLYLKRIGQDV